MGLKPVLQFDPPRPGELQRNALVNAKAKAGLGWSPVHRFEDGLKEIVTWFKQGAP
jgi:nucleoside-diphosphate-sugar epimerase